MQVEAERLSPQHSLFVQNYCGGKCRFNATKAAIAAGYSPKSARTIGARLVLRQDVRAEIDRLQHTAPSDAELSYQQFVELCSEKARGTGRDSTAWAALLTKAKGWGLETTRVLHDQLPPPTLVLPSAVGIAGQDPAPKELTEPPTVIEAEVQELSPTAEPGEDKQQEASEKAQVVEVQDVEAVKPS